MSSTRSWAIRDAHPGDLDSVLRLIELAKGQVDTRPVDLVGTLVHLRSGSPGMVESVDADIVGGGLRKGWPSVALLPAMPPFSAQWPALSGQRPAQIKNNSPRKASVIHACRGVFSS